jgi:hypothetical protein
LDTSRTSSEIWGRMGTSFFIEQRMIPPSSL